MAGLAPAKWPLQDQVMWATLLERGSLLDDCGGLTHLRQTSVGVLELCYRQWLGWLTANDAAALSLAPEDRVTIARLGQWLDTLAPLRPMTRLLYLDGAIRVLRIAAPDMDWSRHLKLLVKLRRLAGHGDPARKAGRILCSSTLLAAGLSYAVTHSKAKPTLLQSATRLQTGTMIAMLALMPMRCRTFRLLELGRSVHVESSRIVVNPPGDTMKSGLSWEADVPEIIVPLLRRYIEEVRPWLMQINDQQHSFLWVTNLGRPFTNGYIGLRIAVATTEATGVRVSPHLIRDAAATTLARSSPESAKLIKPVLAHTCFETAENHYIHAGSIEAGRDYASLIRNMRKKT